jgi:ATP-binding cassette subfamily F protein uup
MQISELSGGQKKRLALAMLLLDKTDLIVMDEPTNHLDIEMIEWLEEYLSASHITLLMVTHDRYFLDRVCNMILELEDRKVYVHKGNYSFFLEKKAMREEAQAAEVAKARQLMKKELDWIRRQPKARGTKAKYRIDAFEETRAKARSGKKTVDFNLEARMQRLGGKILELKKVSKSFGELQILQDFSYTFKKGERIGIVGPNGVGKSTFLNLLAGVMEADSGKIIPGETLSVGYYNQRGIDFKEEEKMIDVITKVAEVIEMADGSKVSASQFLNLFHFPPIQQHTPVSKLSGGEKRRLYLLTVLIKNPNFLILDEPTNDLDILTLNRLEEFLLNFKGCLLMVSHDRYFMDKLVDHLFVFEGEAVVRDFNGSYSDYREDLEFLKAKEEEAAARLKSENKSSKEKRITDRKKKRSYKEQKEFESLENEIETLETEKSELEVQLSSGIKDHQSITEISVRIAEIMKMLDQKMTRWIELEEIQ